MKLAKQYTGSVYIGVVGPEVDPGVCRDSIHAIIQRPGDIGPNWCRATKGYEARQVHFNKFMESTADFILLLDHDMIFSNDCLERLRSHGLPYVSGLYMRRDYKPVAPIWFHPWEGAWPLRPWGVSIERGKLHPLGASGWGCVLLHREVVLAVRAILKGEQDIIEDDMDVWPYDLDAVMTAIRGLRALVKERPSESTLYPAFEAHLSALEREIRPLRGDHEPIGSDIRFPFYARAAGYQLMGDPDVRCGHLLNYPLSATDFDAMGDSSHNELQANIDKRVNADRKRLNANLRTLKGGRRV